MGNIGSVCNALDYLGANYEVSFNRNDLPKADAIILPGVGAFGAAMENLYRRDLVDELTKQVLIKKKLYFGICLGMQLIAYDSVEMGYSKGFGWIHAHVQKMVPSLGLMTPHVGWNNVICTNPSPLFKQIDEGSHFYFDHSYHIQCAPDLVTGICEYGGRWVAALQKDNIFATQFHPEKSQRNGLKLLRNFLNLVELH
jgi:imidazole glycerol-phosphate synthase subunit HisH